MNLTTIVCVFVFIILPVTVALLGLYFFYTSPRQRIVRKLKGFGVEDARELIKLAFWIRSGENGEDPMPTRTSIRCDWVEVMKELIRIDPAEMLFLFNSPVFRASEYYKQGMVRPLYEEMLREWIKALERKTGAAICFDHTDFLNLVVTLRMGGEEIQKLQLRLCDLLAKEMVAQIKEDVSELLFDERSLAYEERVNGRFAQLLDSPLTPASDVERWKESQEALSFAIQKKKTLAEFQKLAKKPVVAETSISPTPA